MGRKCSKCGLACEVPGVFVVIMRCELLFGMTASQGRKEAKSRKNLRSRPGP